MRTYNMANYLGGIFENFVMVSAVEATGPVIIFSMLIGVFFQIVAIFNNYKALKYIKAIK